jgi:hypothetical protein
MWVLFWVQKYLQKHPLLFVFIFINDIIIRVKLSHMKTEKEATEVVEGTPNLTHLF